MEGMAMAQPSWRSFSSCLLPPDQGNGSSECMPSDTSSDDQRPPGADSGPVTFNSSRLELPVFCKNAMAVRSEHLDWSWLRASPMAEDPTAVPGIIHLITDEAERTLPSGISLLAKDGFVPQFEQQFPGGTGGLGTGTAQTSGAQVGQPTGLLGLQFIPSITLSERYDTNVFFVPKIPGLQREDYVTTLTPTLFFRNVGRLVDATLSVGATGEKYVNNPGLSYVGYNAGTNIVLDQLVQRFAPGATLRFGDSFLYTPNPPAFLSGDTLTTQVVGPENASQVTPADFFVRGIQAFRVNTYTNSASVAASYPVTPTTRFVTAYSNSIIRFGTPFVRSTQQQTLFGSTTHIVMAGPEIRPSPRDTLTLNYIFMRSEVEGGGAGTFTSHGASLGWLRVLSPELTAKATGGIVLVQVEGLGAATGGNALSYIGGASIAWSRRNVNASVNYSAGVYPSFFVGAGPLLSQTVNAVGSYQMLDNRLVASAGVNYSRNDGIEPGPVAETLSFESYGTNAGLVYTLAPTTLISFSHSFQLFKGFFGFAATTQEFSRNVLMISLTKHWR